MTTFLTGTPSKPHPSPYHECNAYCVDGQHCFTLWVTDDVNEAGATRLARLEFDKWNDEVVRVKRSHETPSLDVALASDPRRQANWARSEKGADPRPFRFGFLVFTRSTNGSY